VTFWDVLDQVDDPLGALRAVVPLLAPGGLLLARGRNGTLHAMLKRAALRVRGVVPWFPDPAVVHRWGFGRRAWRAVLGRAGLGGIVVRPAGPRIGRLAASMLATGRKPRAAGLPDDRFGRTRRLSTPDAPWTGGPSGPGGVLTILHRPAALGRLDRYRSGPYQ
jgi:hypothetical protein